MKFTSITSFIPYAFRRYPVTSVLSTISILMALFMIFSELSNMQVTKKKGKKKLPEYQATLYPVKKDAVNEDAWIKEVKALLAQNKFECYSWIYNGKKVIDILNLYDRKADIHKIEEIIQKKGYPKGDVKIDIHKISNRFDTYTIEFESPDKASSARCAWNEAVEQLLSEKDYCTSEEYDCRHSPAALNVSYPPFREASALIGFIKERKLKEPSSFSVYENNPAENPEGDVVYNIKGSKDSIQISGFMPFGKFNPHIHHDRSIFTVTVVNPKGKISAAQASTHPVTGFLMNYPKDFMTKCDTLIPGIYKVRCSLNGQKAFEINLEISKTYAIIGYHNNEPKRVFYSRIK